MFELFVSCGDDSRQLFVYRWKGGAQTVVVGDCVKVPCWNDIFSVTREIVVISTC